MFGETTRELKKEFISNNVTNETAEASLEFSIDDKEYEIIRTIKPSKCTLYENGVDISRDSMANTTEFVLSILNLTPEIFSNCICLSINSTIPFMAQKKIDKRKFIEGIFNLDVFSRMNISLKDNYNQSKKEIEFLGGKQTELGNSIKIITTQNTKISEEREKRKKIINDNISNYDHQLEKLKEKVSKYKIDDNSDSIKKIDKLKIKKSTENDKIQEFIKESTETVTKIKISKDNLSKIGTDKEECPICLRAITEDDIKHVDERKANISDEIGKLNNHSISLLASLKVLKQNVELIDKGINSLNDNVNKNNLNIQQKKNDEEKISYIEKEVGKEVSLLEDLNKASVEEEKGVDDLLERYKKFDNEILKKKKALEERERH